MELIVDLHVHSHYSRATSRDCTLEGLYFWGKQKGITIIGTGDFTHPAWFAELQDKLEVTEGGLLQLKKRIADEIDKTLPATVRDNPLRFVPTVEIASVYRKQDKTRKLHQLVIMPSLAMAGRLNRQLERVGNLQVDGRPVFKLDAKEVLRIALEVTPDVLYIPAHIWTPWFGMFGSKSGFDTIAEAYEELSPEIHAIETGLSSDPIMNRQLKQLDRIAITSNSDAHSPRKLGREATVLQGDPTYADVTGAMKTNDARLVGTIEFFPEEGKYYADGHRTCGVFFTPEQTKVHGGICPVCGKPLVVGVNYRVSQLADRTLQDVSVGKTVEYIVPLAEAIAEQYGVQSVQSKRVQQRYDELIAALGDEFSILRRVPLVRIGAFDPALAAAIERIRTNRVLRTPGYDGVYGKIAVFPRQ